MIAEQVLGVYASMGSLPPGEQAGWYRKAARDWGIGTFEIPFFAGVPVAPELTETFAALPAALVVTLVAQWAGAGQADPAYGLASTMEAARQTALLDAAAVTRQCLTLSQ